MILILLLPACIQPDAQSSTATSSNDTTTSSSTSGASSSTTVVGTSTGEAPTDITSFITRPDGGSIDQECSIWDQDCPPGEKCNPRAVDGGSSWNGTRCFPLDPDPDAVGEPCTVTGSPVSGLDSCDVGAMCWDIDPTTQLGTCIAFCAGSPNAAFCASPDMHCRVSGDGILNLCVPNCDPQDAGTCATGHGCYPIYDDFTCAPDASGEDNGGPFDACEFVNACDPGSACGAAEAVGACSADASACCTPYCDLNAPSCPKGTSCVPYYDDVPRPGYEDLGFCGAAR